MERKEFTKSLRLLGKIWLIHTGEGAVSTMGELAPLVLPFMKQLTGKLVTLVEVSLCIVIP